MRPESSQLQDRISSFDRVHTMEEHPTKALPEMDGSPQDQDDMTRMGKIQELKVLFALFDAIRTSQTDLSKAQLSTPSSVELFSGSSSYLGVYTYVRDGLQCAHAPPRHILMG
jgi:hypothetical protein